MPKGGFTNIKKEVRAGGGGENIENGVEKKGNSLPYKNDSGGEGHKNVSMKERNAFIRKASKKKNRNDKALHVKAKETEGEEEKEDSEKEEYEVEHVLKMKMKKGAGGKRPQFFW